jgi:hypothetical protein
MVVIIVAIIGAMGYRYYSILDARKARVQISAARLGSLLLESWKGTGGRSEPADEYNPLHLEFGSVPVSGPVNTGPSVPADFSAFGRYIIVVDGATYYVTLSYRDDTLNNLRALNACVSWPHEYPTGIFSSTDQSVKLTTKVNLPES